MAAYFDPSPTVPGGAAIALEEVEVSILRSLVVQLLELIGPGPAEDEDPLAELFAEGPSEAPSDPALARLFPDAYAGPGQRPDAEAEALSAEFRRFTENDLRARKRDDGLAVVRSLDSLVPDGSAGAVLTLTPEQSRQWLGTLNDLRLTLASRLHVSSEDDTATLYELDDEDPRKPLVMAYLWLGGLQESLVETLAV
ncbi:DUF2017 domain-containing protein [Streptomyces alkaliterrae]|uniref:DUF2017 domain-containing protein n=1 Tax=Streptomyces alkaliterrae TaxID=2213162 RepID=A0A5P0YR44_9ACTN|nr:DUF2017 domain-containing protein [Streptomyces alkaliterrae]MBB1262190.1 DUF2017 domain-containing protein [Streptomyces alkaliterrae]MQS02735.1 DUF2017 family protein [Streptomyces alkaliterrae]